MKPRISLILFSCLVVLLPLMAQPSHSQSPTALTETNIQAMINGLDRATRKGSVAGILAPLTSDVKIKVAVLNPKSDKEVVATLNKDQYSITLRQVLRRRISYQFERKNTRIKIYDAQTATVTSELYETLKFRQGTLRGSSSEVMHVGLRNGKVMITGVDSRTRLY